MAMRTRDTPVLAALVLAAGVASGARSGRAGDAGLAILDCRGACFAFSNLSCGGVEAACGGNRDVIDLDGLPFNCSDVEPVACHLGLTAMEDCLAGCGEGSADYAYGGP
jgi:hypothetical protein